MTLNMERVGEESRGGEREDDLALVVCVTADEMAEKSAAEGGHGGRRGQFTHQLMKKK